MKVLIISSLILCCLSVSSYNDTLGLHLCKLTVASYCRPTKIYDWSCEPCINSPIRLSNIILFHNSTGDVLGYIGTSTSPRAMFLVFRGTKIKDIKNWIQDDDFIKINFPACHNQCQVHRGFYRDYLQISARVTSAVIDYRARLGVSTIIIAGHSLGGALATHAAIQLVNKGLQIEALYTFGSPRVGDNKFSTWFDTFVKTNHKVRVTHGHDPVPHLPTQNIDFNHVPHEIFYKAGVKDGFITCNDSGSKEDPNCCNKYLTDFLISDHLTYYDIDFNGIASKCQ